jgi:3-hydroxybutyryl-CoA dehydrogenase
MTIALAVTKNVVVIGAGTMGCGICEVAAGAGHRVFLLDTNDDALSKAVRNIGKSLARRVDKGRLDGNTRDEIMNRITATSNVADIHGVGLVIEVIVENLTAKVLALRALLSHLETDTIIATNTSSLSVTALAAQLENPSRVIGMHFFNPAQALPLVEVVQGAATSELVVATVVATAKAWGKTPVVCRSTPGFIVNRVARPFYGEGLRLLQERFTDPSTLDAVMRECGGFRMGPCELMDLIGHDINLAVTQSVFDGFFGDGRYKPSLVQKELVDAGWLGRKTERGFYTYIDGKALAAPHHAPLFLIPTTLEVEGMLGPAEVLVALVEEATKRPLNRSHATTGVIRLDGFAMALTDGRSATERSSILGEPVVLFDLAFDYRSCSLVAVGSGAEVTPEHLARVVGFFHVIGKEVSMLGDAPGLAVMRTVAMLVNEAADAVQQGIASSTEIDIAMRLGVNYPAGPFQWGESIGLERIVEVLANLGRCYGEERYRVSIWLQRAVFLRQRARSLNSVVSHG